MKADKWVVALLSVFTLQTATPAPASPVHSVQFEELVARCAPEIHPQTFKGIVTTESGFNPFAIGVVNGKVERTPRSQAEAIATAKDLEKNGFNFSLGLAQVNRYNLAKYGETYETIFEPCRNIRTGAAILKDCYVRARARIADEQQALRASFSCYYSGNFKRGFIPDRPGEPGYVQKVVANALGTPTRNMVPAVEQKSSDDAATVRPVDGSAVVKKSKPARATDWVIFGDAQQVVQRGSAPLMMQQTKLDFTPVSQDEITGRRDDIFVVVVD